MDKIKDAIQEWFLEILRGFCLSSINGMFDSVNTRVGSIATELGKSPQNWNGNIFSMIRNISDNVILPIAGLILAAVLTYEFISLIIEKNNMHDVPMETFGKIFLKMGICIYMLSHTFDFVMAIFDVTQKIVNKAGGLINNSGTLEVTTSVEDTLNQITNPGELISIALLAMVLSWVLKGVSLAIMVVLYGRMIQIYLYSSVAPIPFATFGNKDWGNIGTNYIRGLVALGLQAFFMLICVAIYSALVQSLNTTSDIMGTLTEMVGYTILLVISLFKTHQTAQSIMNAH